MNIKIQNKVMKKIVLALCITALVAIASQFTAFAQVENGEALDKVVAVVGNEVILLSDIKGQLALMASQNPNMNPNDPALYKQILDGIINEKLLVVKAVEDSVQVSDEQIDARWQVFLQSLIQQVGSEDRIEQIYQKSVSRLKFELRDEIRNKLLSTGLMQQKFAGVSATSREIQEFYAKYKDSLQIVPPQFEIFHITKIVEPDTSSRNNAYSLAKKVRDSILKGGDFAGYAQTYSGDPGTASLGGDLGWTEKGKFVPEFEKAAFALQTGETSMPIESPFGYHLIQTLDKRKESVHTRHILFKIQQSGADKERAKAYLDSIRTAVAKGASFQEMAKLYSDDKDTKGFGGYVGKLSKKEIGIALAESLEKLKDGEISEALPYQVSSTKQALEIVYKKRFIAEHKATLEDDYKFVEAYALEYKRMNLYTEFIKQLRAELFWEIKD